MPHNVKLNFPPFKFRVTKDERSEELKIWDEIRKTYLVLTPEEWVRQHLVRFLVEHKQVPITFISMEFPVNIQGAEQRADVVVFASDMSPLLLAECKAPSVKMDQSVYAQAVRYNSVVDAQYLLITNGLKHYIYTKSGDGEYVKIDEFPQLNV